MTESKIVRDYAKMGAQLGAAFAVMAEAGRAFNAACGFAVQAMQAAAERERTLARARATGTLTPEQRDALSEIRYAARVAAERHAGLAHVRRHARQARRELGLPR